jgi:flagellar motility protein MotE (MotC chaperone)
MEEARDNITEVQDKIVVVERITGKEIKILKFFLCRIFYYSISIFMKNYKFTYCLLATSFISLIGFSLPASADNFQQEQQQRDMERRQDELERQQRQQQREQQDRDIQRQNEESKRRAEDFQRESERQAERTRDFQRDAEL